ncbi:MAG: 23S rRNA (adenine(2030)-N(6))-methyltransferase RlmJ [Alphaproteobacteria bacterium]|nr:23S rRNA (adenine(2030)-N(6))-methyltransferase RlmJ [Alphaproteobacteria bacterium]
MNYRHGYHAGNFADVLKHTALGELLRLLTAKDKKLFVLDTHAGAGGYDLGGEQARRTAEAETGIVRLAAAPRAGMPAPVAHYLAAVAAYDRKFGSSGGAWRHYPGSPRFVRAALRPGDRFVACELHADEALALKREFAGDRAVEVRQADGYKTLKALLPPPERRGLMLIDPPFEAADEFERVLRALRQGVRRFATGCYAVWYPIKDAQGEAFARAMAAFRPLTLQLALPANDTGKLSACALAVVNPPWRFEEAMREALPWIAQNLGSGVTARVHAPPASAPVPASPA